MRRELVSRLSIETRTTRNKTCEYPEQIIGKHSIEHHMPFSLSILKFSEVLSREYPESTSIRDIPLGQLPGHHSSDILAKKRKVTHFFFV